MKQRTRLAATLVAAALLVVAAPGIASAAEDYTATPNQGPAGTTISVASTRPCEDPGSATIESVEVVVTNGHRIAGEASLTAAPDRTWAGSVTIEPGARNGRYAIVALCVYSDDTLDFYGFFDDAEEFLVTSAAGVSDPVVRVAGTDRIGTAIATSKDLVVEDQSRIGVVLSRSDSYADALAGTPLAALYDAPLLLTASNTLDPRTEAEIKRVLLPGGEVHLLGGTDAISTGVAERLTALGFEVARYAGINRYDTAVKVASIGIGDPTAVLLATGTDFRAGLVAGAAAPHADADPFGYGVVLLTNGNAMPAETSAYLQSLGSVPRYAVGPEAAAADPAATKIVGANHAELSVLVAERFFGSTAEVGFASAAAFPDALSGGAHAALHRAPLLLTDTNALPPSVGTFLGARKADVVIGFVYGGTAVVSETVRTAIIQAIS